MPSYKDEKTNTWYCQFWYKDWTGQRKHKVKRGFKLKRDADNWEKDFQNQKQTADITMGFLIEEFKKNLQVLFELKVFRRQTYIGHLRNLRLYIAPHFPAEIKVKDIEVLNINQWLLNLQKQPCQRKKGKTLASSTILSAKSTLNKMFEFAITNYKLTANPIDKAEKVKYHSNDERAKIWTLEQYAMFYNDIKNEELRVIFNLIFFSGLRIGEALALTPQTISSMKVLVRHSYDSQVDEFGPPKTPSSKRDTDIPHFIYQQLTDFMKRIYKLGANERIFSYKYSSVYGYLTRSCRRLGLPYISLHNLRHSYASILYSRSKDITAVSSQLGHSNSQITLQVYTHMIPIEKRNAVEKLEDYTIKTHLLPLEAPTIDISKS